MRPDVRAVSSLVFAVSLLIAGAPARASQPAPSCNCAPTAELTALRDRIAAAPNLATAQEMAVAPVERARSVVAKLSWISSSLRDAEKRMADYESNVRTAKAPAAVADHFGSLVRLASSGAVVSDGVSTSGCSYSTGEIIAIVLGFLLAIIPGIILLILLC
jgi:hypothetical protein